MEPDKVEQITNEISEQERSQTKGNTKATKETIRNIYEDLKAGATWRAELPGNKLSQVKHQRHMQYSQTPLKLSWIGRGANR